MKNNFGLGYYGTWSISDPGTYMYQLQAFFLPNLLVIDSNANMRFSCFAISSISVNKSYVKSDFGSSPVNISPHFYILSLLYTLSRLAFTAASTKVKTLSVGTTKPLVELL